MTDRTSNLPAKAEAGADAPASFSVFPVPQSGMSRIGAFALGILTGVIGVAVAATIFDEVEGGSGSSGESEDEPDEADGISE